MSSQESLDQVAILHDMYNALGTLLGAVVLSMDNVIHWINHYPVDGIVCFASTYLLDDDLSS